MELARAIGAAPMARIRYRREAYESPAGDTVRLTLDSALTYARPPASISRSTAPLGHRPDERHPRGQV